MTQLGAPRNTPKMGTDRLRAYPVADNVLCYQGAIAVVVAGYLQPATTTTGGFRGGGRVRHTADNTVSGHTLGGITGEIEFGCFKYANGDSIAQADVGKPAYAVDDQTVAKGASGKSRLGIIAQVDSDGVWVEFDSPDDIALENDIAAATTTAAAAVPLASVQQATGTLVAGDVAIATLNITASSVIVPIRDNPDPVAGHWGNLTITTIVPGTPGSFHVHSSSNTDVSGVRAVVIG